jgi:hypothetical protein
MSQTPKLLTRKRAAERFSQIFGTAYSPKHVGTLPIHFRLINRNAMYDEADIDAYAAELLRNAPLRIGSPKRRDVPPSSGRFERPPVRRGSRGTIALPPSTV